MEGVLIWYNEYISCVDNGVVKDQGQIYFKYVLVLVMPNPLSFLMEGVHI